MKESFAVGTLLSAILWFIISAFDFKYIKYKKNEMVYMIILPCTFLTCGYLLPSVAGLIVYLSVAALSSVLLMNEDCKYLFGIIKEWLTKKGKRQI